MNVNYFRAKRFVFCFFSILFCFCFLVFGLCLKYSSSFLNKIDSFISFNSEIKHIIKDRLQTKILLSSPVRFLKNRMGNLTGKSLFRGVYKEGETLLNIPYLPEKFQIGECCSEISKFCNRIDSTPYVLILPTKFQLNGGFVDFRNFNSYENDLINFFYLKLDEKIINLYSNFFFSYSDNLDFFYRTDSSLNSFGNFLIYSYLLKDMNFQPFTMDSFQIRTLSYNFNGNLFSENFIDIVEPDTIELFEIIDFDNYNFSKLKVKQINSDLSVDERDSVFDLSRLTGFDKKEVFFGGRAPFKIVETDLDDAENILIFSDGSVDGLMQFLVLHFKKLIVVDLKQIKLNYRLLHNFLKNFNVEHEIRNFENVLFLYGIESLADSKVFKQILTDFMV